MVTQTCSGGGVGCRMRHARGKIARIVKLLLEERWGAGAGELAEVHDQVFQPPRPSPHARFRQQQRR